MSAAALAPMFPAAMRAMNALETAHSRHPSKVSEVASLLEKSLQAYGRCLLASAGSPVIVDEGESTSIAHKDIAVREAEAHLLWRARLRSALSSVAVGSDASTERCVEVAIREVDHLMFTLDQVLAARGVHCTSVTSGVHA